MIKRNAAILLIAALVFGVGATAWAQGAPERPKLTDDQKSTLRTCLQQAKQNQDREAARQCFAAAGVTKGEAQARKPGVKRGIERRAIHGDLIVRNKDGQFVPVTFDRGTLEAKGDNTLTLKRPDGVTVTVTVDDATKYKGVDSFAEVETGKRALVFSRDGKALVVCQRYAEEGPAPEFESLETA
jgi:hypothetical protein